MIAIVILILATGAAPALGCQDADERNIEARVDARVELMSIIFRLTGAEEYNQPQAKSPYVDEVDTHFGAHRDHPVVQAASELRARHGVSYDAPMTLAVHLKDTVSLGERIPLDRNPPRLASRWPVADLPGFLEKARDFARDTGFNEFFKNHREFYQATGERMAAQLAKRAYVNWFDLYFGARPGAKFYVIIGMLNGSCNYASGIQYPDGTQEVISIIGAARFDGQGIPVFDDRIDSTVVHEFCHCYTNPLVDKHAKQLESPGRELFSHCEQVMRQQAYGTWKATMYESFVRAVVVRHMLATDGAAAASAEIQRQRGRGFRWVGALSDVLAEYESQRTRYPTFDSFMPRIISFFDQYARDYEKLLAEERARAPKVVRTIPPNGATDVDPSLMEIKVFFDRPMKDRCWAVVGGGPEHPEIAGDVYYDQQRRVFTMPVRLKPGWSYRFHLNSERYRDFRGEDGVALQPVEVTFTTRAE